MRSGPEYVRFGRGELFVCQRARGVQLREVFELVGRVRRRRRILRLVLILILILILILVLVVAGRRLVVGLLLPGLPGLVVSYRPPATAPAMSARRRVRRLNPTGTPPRSPRRHRRRVSGRLLACRPLRLQVPACLQRIEGGIPQSG